MASSFIPARKATRIDPIFDTSEYP
jgi:hypothetical protein